MKEKEELEVKLRETGVGGWDYKLWRGEQVICSGHATNTLRRDARATALKHAQLCEAPKVTP